MKQILVIEDDRRVAAALQLRFASRGHRTLVAQDAVVGAYQATHRQLDLIVLDISLPGGNGLDLARRLRGLPQTSAIPMIVVTGSKDPRMREKAMELNMAGLLEKPYDPAELLGLAEHAMNQVWRKAPANSAAARRSSGPGVATRSAEPGPGASAKKILIVEDDERIGKALALRLKSAGYATAQAHDALAGVSTAVQYQPDLILLDISMPAGNGFLIAERLQALLPRPVPTIFLTASKKPDFYDRAMRLGAAAYFEKPYAAEALLASIQRTLNEAAQPA